jgi:cytochrome P450
LELPSQITQWLFAFDPAGMVTARALALLGCHPEEQNKAFKEAGTDRPYSRAVFLEAVRLWPTSPAILRDLTEDYELGGHIIKKGTGIIIFSPLFHRDTDRIEFANRMHTSTWTDKEADPSIGFVPFSAGPVVCLGHNLVPMVGSLVIDELLYKAKVKLLEPSLDPEVLLGTLDHFEIKLSLSKRTAEAA